MQYNGHRGERVTGIEPALSAWEEFLSHRVLLSCSGIGGLSAPLVAPSGQVLWPVCGPTSSIWVASGSTAGPEDHFDSGVPTRRRNHRRPGICQTQSEASRPAWAGVWVSEMASHESQSLAFLPDLGVFVVHQKFSGRVVG